MADRKRGNEACYQTRRKGNHLEQGFGELRVVDHDLPRLQRVLLQQHLHLQEPRMHTHRHQTSVCESSETAEALQRQLEPFTCTTTANTACSIDQP